ncbi:hypothetical protein, partial [Pseudomonas syringae]|uniref:hypothetical protein n=1 Tax=Pseudomonas syringae TaxID=317 RepID=UPI001F1A1AD4
MGPQRMRPGKGLIGEVLLPSLINKSPPTRLGNQNRMAAFAWKKKKTTQQRMRSGADKYTE